MKIIKQHTPHYYVLNSTNLNLINFPQYIYIETNMNNDIKQTNGETYIN